MQSICRNRPQALTCFHTDPQKVIEKYGFPYLFQSPSSSYLFSHVIIGERNIEEKLWKIVAIALRLLPVFTQLLFLMQKTCAFLNPKILTSLSNPF